MSSSNPNIASSHSGRAYSADVRLYLILEDGTRLPLAQVGPDLVIFREPKRFQGEAATVEVQIDGVARRHLVRMPVQQEPARLVRTAPR